MGQYSSLCEGAVVKFPRRCRYWRGRAGQSGGWIRKGRGKQRRETGEGQNEDASNRQSNAHHGWHEDGMNARHTDILGGSS